MIAEAKPEVNALILAKWQNMLDFVANLFGVKVSMITRVKNHSIETILNNKGAEERVVKKQNIGEGSFCDIVINNNQPLAVENVFNDEKWAMKDENRVAYLGVPIRWPDEEIFGTLAIEDNKEHTFTKRYHEIMSSFEDMVNTDLALLMESDAFDRRSTFNHMSIHHIKSAIIIYDAEFIIRSYNEVAETITDYSREEVLGRHFDELKTTLVLARPLCQANCMRLIVKKRP